MRLALALAIPFAAVLACSSPSQPSKAEPTVNNQQIIDRLTDDIWPAVSAYNGAPTQASRGAKQYRAIVDPTDNGATAYGPLREAVQKLGRQGEYDRQTQTTHYNDELNLVHVDVRSVQDNTATLNVCYTYTHRWYVDFQNRRHAPGASEATVELTNVDNNWYLHAITNDHVVPNCAGNSS